LRGASGVMPAGEPVAHRRSVELRGKDEGSEQASKVAAADGLDDAA